MIDIIERFLYSKVLPMVYDNTLSFLEAMYKLLTKLNEVISVSNSNTNTLDTIRNTLDSLEARIENAKASIRYLKENCAYTINNKEKTPNSVNIELDAVNIPCGPVVGMQAQNVQDSLEELKYKQDNIQMFSYFGYVNISIPETADISVTTNATNVQPSDFTVGTILIGNTGNIGRVTEINGTAVTVSSIGASVVDAGFVFCNGNAPRNSQEILENTNFTLYPVRTNYPDGTCVIGANGYISVLDDYQEGNYNLTGTGAKLPGRDPDVVGFLDVTDNFLVWIGSGSKTEARVLEYIATLSPNKYFITYPSANYQKSYYFVSSTLPIYFYCEGELDNKIETIVSNSTNKTRLSIGSFSADYLPTDSAYPKTHYYAHELSSKSAAYTYAEISALVGSFRIETSSNVYAHIERNSLRLHDTITGTAHKLKIDNGELIVD